MPLLRHGAVVGALNLEADTLDHFRSYDESLLDLVATTIATALAQARDHAALLHKERGWSERFDTLTRLHRTILESRDEATLLQELATRIVRLSPAFALCGIRLFDLTKGKLLLMGLGHRSAPPSFRAGGPLIPVHSISGRAILEGRSIIAPDLENQEEFFNKQLATDFNLRDMVAVPIPGLDTGEGLGCINVYTAKSTNYQFQDEDVGLLGQIASFVAIALANLRKSLELSAHRETSLECRHAPTSRETLDAVAALARRMTRARGASIFLRDGSLLRLKGTTGVDAADPAAVSYQIGQGKTGWVVGNGRAIRLIDRADLQEVASYPGLVEMHQFAERPLSPDRGIQLVFSRCPSSPTAGGRRRARRRQGRRPAVHAARSDHHRGHLPPAWCRDFSLCRTQPVHGLHGARAREADHPRSAAPCARS